MFEALRIGNPRYGRLKIRATSASLPGTSNHTFLPLQQNEVGQHALAKGAFGSHSLNAREVEKKQAAAMLNDAAGNFDVVETIRQIEEDMLKAANNLEFEKAALLRDQVRELKRSTGQETGEKSGADAATKAVRYSKKVKARREAFR